MYASTEFAQDWLAIRAGRAKSFGLPVVDCPRRGECAVSTCVQCPRFRAIALDPETSTHFVGCSATETTTRDVPQCLLTEYLHDDGDRLLAVAFVDQSDDGTWAGWLEFIDPTGIEPTRAVFDFRSARRSDALAWAAGLTRWNARPLRTALEVVRQADVADPVLRRSRFAESANGASAEPRRRSGTVRIAEPPESDELGGTGELEDFMRWVK